MTNILERTVPHWEGIAAEVLGKAVKTEGRSLSPAYFITTYEEYLSSPGTAVRHFKNIAKHHINRNYQAADVSDTMRTYMYLTKASVPPLCACGERARIRVVRDGLLPCPSCTKAQVSTRVKLNQCRVLPSGETVAQRSARKAVVTRSKVGEDGLTSIQRASKKLSIARSRVLLSGETVAQRITRKATITMKEVDSSGVSGYQRLGAKSSATKKLVGKDGLTSSQRGALIMRDKRSVVGEDGLTGFQRTAQATREERIVVGEDGLTGYQRAGVKVSETGLRKGKEHRASRRLQLIEAHGEEFFTQEYVGKRTRNQLAEELGVSIPASYSLLWLWDLVPKPDDGFSTSKEEKDVRDYIRSLGVVTKKDRKLLQGKEVDILCEEEKVAVEYNGLYWHNENHKAKDYHLRKTTACEEQGFQLLHVNSSDWLTKNAIVKSMLAEKLGRTQNVVYGRCTVVREIPSKQSSAFLASTHLQGNVNASVRYGLFQQEELLAVMTFSKARYSTKYDYELLRFSSALNTRVVGGASKLLAAFRRKFPEASIISYADREHSTGNVYRKLGFTEKAPNAISYRYTKDFVTLESRIKYQPHKLSKILAVYSSELSEEKNMHANGYFKLYNCGNRVFTINPA